MVNIRKIIRKHGGGKNPYDRFLNKTSVEIDKQFRPKPDREKKLNNDIDELLLDSEVNAQMEVRDGES